MFYSFWYTFRAFWFICVHFSCILVHFFINFVTIFVNFGTFFIYFGTLFVHFGAFFIHFCTLFVHFGAFLAHLVHVMPYCVAGCSAWSVAPGVRPPSCSPKWWCARVTWCSTCTASRARCATRPSTRATNSAWRTALCCVRSTTNSPCPRSSIIHPHQPPSLEAARTRLHFRPPSSTLITTTRRFRRPPRRSAPTVWSVTKCPTSTAPPRGRRGRRDAPGSGNRKTWRPWPQI